jgi:hypothetical protein
VWDDPLDSKSLVLALWQQAMMTPALRLEVLRALERMPRAAARCPILHSDLQASLAGTHEDLELSGEERTAALGVLAAMTQAAAADASIDPDGVMGVLQSVLQAGAECLAGGLDDTPAVIALAALGAVNAALSTLCGASLSPEILCRLADSVAHCQCALIEVLEHSTSPSCALPPSDVSALQRAAVVGLARLAGRGPPSGLPPREGQEDACAIGEAVLRALPRLEYPVWPTALTAIGAAQAGGVLDLLLPPPGGVGGGERGLDVGRCLSVLAGGRAADEVWAQLKARATAMCRDGRHAHAVELLEATALR